MPLKRIRMLFRYSLLSFFALMSVVMLASGCKEKEAISTAVPEGWLAEEQQWWIPGTDTSAAFRDLETLESMNVKGALSSDFAFDAGQLNYEAARQLLTVYVKDGLIELFRNHPEIVDSLFEKFVVPKMSDANVDGNVQPEIIKFKKDGYRTISRHFHRPFSLTKLGVDVPLPFPDSLRSSRPSGDMFFQIKVSDEGNPVAVKKLRGMHPVLDRIAMRAMTEMRWQPAYVIRGGKSPPVDSWVRLKVQFAPQQ